MMFWKQVEVNFEFYFHDMLVRSVTVGDHISDLEETFETPR